MICKDEWLFVWNALLWLIIPETIQDYIPFLPEIHKRYNCDLCTDSCAPHAIRLLVWLLSQWLSKRNRLLWNKKKKKFRSKNLICMLFLSRLVLFRKWESPVMISMGFVNRNKSLLYLQQSISFCAQWHTRNRMYHCQESIEWHQH